MRLPFAILLVLALSPIRGATKNFTEPFEKLASQIQILDADGIIYSRNHIFQGEADPKKSQELNDEFASLVKQTSFTDLQQLLAHSDPRVRTLALAALFRQGNPQALPLFFAGKNDAAATFPHSPGMPQTEVSLDHLGPPVPQTVGNIASALLRFYTEKTLRSQIFDEYWKPRENRKTCASWFGARLVAATVGSSSPSPECRAQVDSIRREIDRLPLEESVLTLIWLRNAYPDDSPENPIQFTPTGELVGQARRLGRQQILRILWQQSLSADPDLQPIWGNISYGMIYRFLLAHAKELLLPEDADALRTEGRKAFDRSTYCYPEATLTAAWWTAAAQLQPAQASTILREGYDAMAKANASAESRQDLLLGLCDLPSAEGRRFAVDWFYEAPGTQSERSYNEDRHGFLLMAKKRANVKSLVASLLEDPRSGEMSSASLAEIAEMTNTWLPKPIATLEEVDTLRGAIGKGQSRPPQDVPGLLARLRESVPQWNK